jgi:protein-S-isoprenylcysteine O-methyltransferase Ste14
MNTMSRPLPFVWPYALIFWAIFLWAFFPEFRIVRRASRAQTSTDSKSLQVILAGQSLGSFASFWVAWVPVLQFPAAFRMTSFVLGVALIVAGSVLRRHCWRMLGTSFTGDVRARADQEVVSRGAYRVLRHPSYTAGILLNVGVGFALGNWLSVLLLGVATTTAYIYRMAVEERTLLAVIGEPYRQFMQDRKRLIPFVY